VGNPELRERPAQRGLGPVGMGRQGVVDRLHAGVAVRNRGHWAHIRLVLQDDKEPFAVQPRFAGQGVCGDKSEGGHSGQTRGQCYARRPQAAPGKQHDGAQHKRAQGSRRDGSRHEAEHVVPAQE
jgi:hypothetical protein